MSLLAPRWYNKINLMICILSAGRKQLCVGSKITSVSKLVLLPDPLHDHSQPSSSGKTAIFTWKVMCTRIYFLRGKLKVRQFQRHARFDSKRLITNIVNWFSLFIHFQHFLEDCLEKYPPLGGKDSLPMIQSTHLPCCPSLSQNEPPLNWAALRMPGAWLWIHCK